MHSLVSDIVVYAFVSLLFCKNDTEAINDMQIILYQYKQRYLHNQALEIVCNNHLAVYSAFTTASGKSSQTIILITRVNCLISTNTCCFRERDDKVNIISNLCY